MTPEVSPQDTKVETPRQNLLTHVPLMVWSRPPHRYGIADCFLLSPSGPRPFLVRNSVVPSRIGIPVLTCEEPLTRLFNLISSYVPSRVCALQHLSVFRKAPWPAARTIKPSQGFQRPLAFMTLPPFNSSVPFLHSAALFEKPSETFRCDDI